MYGFPNHARGMQIHAVPEAERAVNTDGRRLPWGYDYPASGIGISENGERAPAEKGPFGRSIGRSRRGLSRSRSKTTEPKREEDRIRAENTAAEDAVFGSMRRAKEEREAMGEVDPNTVASSAVVAATAPPPTAAETDAEPTEVMLYGFGEEMQWAAIDFYERVSNGVVLEDYERQAPGQRYDIARTLGRQAAQRSLSRAAMRKKNRYAGGAHWIKITFDSRQAADLAISRAPHIVRGYLVYAEFYQGRGPQKDEAVVATQAGAQVTSSALPSSFSTRPAARDSPSGSSSATASSATATAPMGPGMQQAAAAAAVGAPTQSSPSGSSTTMTDAPRARLPAASAQTTGSQAAPLPPAAIQTHRRTASRVQGATRAVVLPAEMALAPKQPKASWTSWIGASEIIGSAVPRTADGSFDWVRASLYWRLFWWVDAMFGTDFCGLKSDD